MQNRMPDWEDLRVFLAVARTGSLSAAGRSLGVDQSTVSRRVAALEATLGARLIDRVPGGVVLTPVARDALGLAEEAERRVASFASAVADADAGVRGVVRVALADGIDTFLVVPELPALYTRHPGLCLELVADVAMADLSRREADIALRFVRPEQGPLVARRVAHLTASVWARADLAGNDLAAMGWVDWEQPNAAWPEAQWAARHIAEGRVRFRTNRVEAKVAAIRAGIGAGILPDALARQVPGLARVDAPEGVPGCDAWLVATRPLYDVPRVRVVWDFLAEVTGRLL
ncbi:MAG: LysR family transcriptional regulator [Myxococcota bacterium]